MNVVDSNKLSEIIANLSDIDTDTEGQATSLASIDTKLTTLLTKDFATQATLALIKEKTDNLNAQISTLATVFEQTQAYAKLGFIEQNTEDSLTQLELINSINGFSLRSDTFTATGNGTTVDCSLNPRSEFSLVVKALGAVTSWTVILEGSLDGTNFTPILTSSGILSAVDGLLITVGSNRYPVLYFRNRLSALTIGAGTSVTATILGK